MEKKHSQGEGRERDKSNILYVDKNKNRVDNWLNVNRLQLPLRNHNSAINNNATSSPESQEVSQKISSAKTSIKQIPALFKNSKVEFGKTNVDIGGGRFDLATQYLAEIPCGLFISSSFRKRAFHMTFRLILQKIALSR